MLHRVYLALASGLKMIIYGCTNLDVRLFGRGVELLSIDLDGLLVALSGLVDEGWEGVWDWNLRASSNSSARAVI